MCLDLPLGFCVRRLLCRCLLVFVLLSVLVVVFLLFSFSVRRLLCRCLLVFVLLSVLVVVFLLFSLVFVVFFVVVF